jgi:hypothetical protein
MLTADETDSCKALEVEFGSKDGPSKDDLHKQARACAARVLDTTHNSGSATDVARAYEVLALLRAQMAQMVDSAATAGLFDQLRNTYALAKEIVVYGRVNQLSALAPKLDALVQRYREAAQADTGLVLGALSAQFSELSDLASNLRGAKQ